MAEFYVDKSASEDASHQVHLDRCSGLPATDGLRYVGSYASADAAFTIASGWYHPVSYCPTCLGQS